ncbi:MAG TPA: hypothetical protein VEL47_02025 [Myxococcota bacterium]|nr:hypothetical protein [Myxococcota bacterium]
MANICVDNRLKYKIDAQNKTKYITWNPAKYHSEPAKYFYPQTASWMGYSGTTESGYSLKDNISQSDIVKRE